MSEYLERLQQLQRQSMGALHSISIDTSTLYGKEVAISVFIHLYKWSKDKKNTKVTKAFKHWSISEWHDEAENNKKMREVKQYMVKHEMIEL